MWNVVDSGKGYGQRYGLESIDSIASWMVSICNWSADQCKGNEMPGIPEINELLADLVNTGTRDFLIWTEVLQRNRAGLREPLPEAGLIARQLPPCASHATNVAIRALKLAALSLLAADASIADGVPALAEPTSWEGIVLVSSVRAILAVAAGGHSRNRNRHRALIETQVREEGPYLDACTEGSERMAAVWGLVARYHLSKSVDSMERGNIQNMSNSVCHAKSAADRAGDDELFDACLWLEMASLSAPFSE